MSRIGAGVVLGALAMSSPFTAQAEPSPPASPLPIALEYSHCESLDEDELLKLLTIEFQTLNVKRGAALERVRIACGPSVARVTIDASGALNEVQLGATARAAWPRLLALSVSEIVIESRARLALPERPRALPAPTPARIARRPALPARAGNVRVSGGVTLRRVVRAATWLAGPELGLEFDWTRHFSLALDLRAEAGSTDTDVARVRWTSARAALSALVGGRIGAWRLSLGPGVCLGYLRLSPEVSAANAAGHVVSGAWGGPELAAHAAYAWNARWFASASVDSGVVTWPVAGLLNGERRLVDNGGAWLAGGLALGTQF